MDNIGHCYVTNSIEYAYLLLAKIPLGVECADNGDIIFGDFCTSILRSYKNLVSSLCHHIIDVVLICTGPEMCRVTARRVIASVKNIEPIGNRAIREFVGNSVGVKVLTSKLQGSIAIGISGTHPRPALILGFDIHPAPQAVREKGVSLAVSADALKGLTLNPTSIGSTLGCDSGFLSAATHAVAVRDFFNVLRDGILGHINVSLPDIGHTPRRANVVGGFSFPQLYHNPAVSPVAGGA